MSSSPSLPQRILRKAFRPFYPAYYRWLWRRRFPGSRWFERLVGRWEAMADRGDAPQDAAAWDEQYRRGRWDLMGDREEIPRYAAVAALVRGWSPGGRILDVGCGDGLLRDLLPADPPVEYTGVDVSEAAIERARRRLRGADRVLAADAESWRPEGAFDAVVFNECLYYFREPLAAARAHWDRRVEHGALVVSMFASPRARAIRRRMVATLPLAYELELRNARGTWWLGVFGGRSRDRS